MPAELAVERRGFRQETRILALVGSAHFCSHFFGIALPPLFPLLRGDLDVSYAALGLLLTVSNGATMLCQVPVGVLVDRFGARRLLALGLGVMSGAVAGLGLASGYPALLLLMVLVGVGNSVFHPADYAILSARIRAQRLGRAFSLHTFAGHFGWAVSPAVLGAIAALWGWRAALVCAGLAGLGVTAWLIAQGQALDAAEAAEPDETAVPTAAHPGPKAPQPGLRRLLSTPILLFFLYMVFAAMASGGLNGFTVTVLVGERGVPLATANSALTVLLVTSALAVLLGGHVADRTRRHDLIIVGGFLAGAAVLVLLGLLHLPLAGVMAAMAIIGLAQGIIRPSRDMMVRAAAPAGAMGAVFGFVTMGMNVGGATAPILFGWLVDRGLGNFVFVLAAGAMLVALAAALLANGQAQRDRKRNQP